MKFFNVEYLFSNEIHSTCLEWWWPHLFSSSNWLLEDSLRSYGIFQCISGCSVQWTLFTKKTHLSQENEKKLNQSRFYLLYVLLSSSPRSECSNKQIIKYIHWNYLKNQTADLTIPWCWGIDITYHQKTLMFMLFKRIRLLIRICMKSLLEIL